MTTDGNAEERLRAILAAIDNAEKGGGRLIERVAYVSEPHEGGLLAELKHLDAELRAQGPRPTRLIVHDAETERLLVQAIPRAPEGRLDPFGLRLEIDPDDAPLPGVVYVDFRPASEWSNRKDDA